MKAERIVKHRHFNLQQIGRNTFELLLRNNNCRRHTLTCALEDAFSGYGRLVMFTDSLAKATLEAQAERFASLQARGLDLVENLKEIFSGIPITILAYEDDTICVIAGQDNQSNVLKGIDRILEEPALRFTRRDKDIVEVMVSETARRGGRSRRTPSLADIELDISDGGRAQALFTRWVQGDVEVGKGRKR